MIAACTIRAFEGKDYCYCDRYGLYFEGEAELMAWLAIKEVEELAEETQKEFKERERRTGRSTIDYGKESSGRR
jgi:hypothetical protein